MALFEARIGQKKLYADSYTDIKFQASKFCKKNVRAVDRMLIDVIDGKPLSMPLVVQRDNLIQDGRVIRFGNWV